MGNIQHTVDLTPYQLRSNHGIVVAGVPYQVQGVNTRGRWGLNVSEIWLRRITPRDGVDNCRDDLYLTADSNLTIEAIYLPRRKRETDEN